MNENLHPSRRQLLSEVTRMAFVMIFAITGASGQQLETARDARSRPEDTRVLACQGIYLDGDMRTATSTWYTNDISFLRLVVKPRQCGGSGQPACNPGAFPDQSSWTVYRLDGKDEKEVAVNVAVEGKE